MSAFQQVGFFKMLFFPILLSFKGRLNDLKDFAVVLAWLTCLVSEIALAHKNIIKKACPVTITL